MQHLLDELRTIVPSAITGRVNELSGLALTAVDLPVPLGARVEVLPSSGRRVAAEAIGFRDHRTLLLPLDDPGGVRVGDRVRLVRSVASIGVGPQLLGRVIDAAGRPLDQGPEWASYHRAPLLRAAPAPMERPPIDTALATGVRAIDGLLTCGRGQRLGIFAGSGVGKSTLLGMLARGTQADVNVVALVGERGRETREFIARDLGPEGLARSVVVVATSDDPAPTRLRAAWAATAIAEYFRDQGQDVLLLMDSLTRFAMAQREVGLAAGEPPATRGYPPSTFALLPKLLERAGRTERGSITGMYCVLVEGDDPNEPVADTLRGLLDGHVVLARELAAAGHFPAIDILQSVSRLMPRVAAGDHQTSAAAVRKALALHRERADLISIGAYRSGSDPALDAALTLRANVLPFLRQDQAQVADWHETQAALAALGA